MNGTCEQPPSNPTIQADMPADGLIVMGDIAGFGLAVEAVWSAELPRTDHRTPCRGRHDVRGGNAVHRTARHPHQN